MTPSLAVVVPTTAGRWLAPCLASLREGAPGVPVVVVSESPEAAAAVGSAVGSAVKIVAAPRGAGFATLANLGLARAREGGAGAALLLNDDAFLLDGCLPALGAALDDPRVAAAGPVILGGEGEVQSAGVRVTAWGARVSLDIRDPGPGAAPRDVDALTGAVLLLRLSAWEAAGGFDPGYPFAFEDVDLCLRLRARGGRVVRVGARAVHHGGGTLSPESPRAAEWAVRGHLRLVSRTAPGPLRRPARAAVLALAVADRIRRGAGPGGLEAVWRGWRADAGGR
ncbi:glycosyltransferase family 2 protein [Myxococcota bacterium]|nr:glycosyltransferase family 2 protein [Myxococcota bacterium]